MAYGDCYALQLEALIDDNFVQNTIHYSVTIDGDTDPLSTAHDLAAGFQTANQAAWLNMFAADYNFLGYACKRVFDGGGPTWLQATPSTVGSVSGVSGASLMGGMIGGLYSDPISHKARQVRLTMPSAPLAFISSSAISSSYLAALNAFATLLSTAIVGGFGNTFQFCGFKRKTLVVAAAVLVITDVRVSNHIGVLRKRARPQL